MRVAIRAVAWLGCLVILGGTPMSGVASDLPATSAASLPDLDRGLPGVLDLTTGGLAGAPQASDFADSRAFEAAISKRGDLAYDDAQDGTLFIASGFAAPLGTRVPKPQEVMNRIRALEPRRFLSGVDLAPGSWLGVRTRAGQGALLRVVDRTSEVIRVRWVVAATPGGVLRSADIEALAAVSAPRITSAWLSPLQESGGPVLRLADGHLAPGPVVGAPFSAERLASLPSAVGEVGDLSYFRLRSGMLVVASGRLARLGSGAMAALESRDLRPRLRRVSFLPSEELSPGAVFLIETRDQRHALVRVDAVEAERLRLSWLWQSDGTARFRGLARFDASFERPPAEALEHLLLKAVARGDRAATQKWLALGADPNTRRGRGARPPLVHAVLSGESSVATLLLEAGAAPAVEGVDGWRALHVAAQLGAHEMAELLLSAGADPDASTPMGQTAFEIAAASPRRSLALLRLLRQSSQQPDSLVRAAEVGDLAAVSNLIALGVDLEETEGGSRSALRVAASSGQAEVVRLLLAAGARWRRGASHTRGPLLEAVDGRHVATVVVLLEHGTPSRDEKLAALARANELGSPDLVRALLAAGVPADADAGAGLSAIDQALQYGSRALVDVYVERGNPLTPAAAARLGLVEPLRALLEAGALPTAAGPDGRLPVQQAIANGRLESLRVLLDGGADAAEPLPTWDRRSPLHEAASAVDPRLLALLLDRGGDVNRVDRVGRTPLYQAVAHRREAAARVLLEHGADPNLAPEGEALLDFARTEEMRALLTRYGAESAASPAGTRSSRFPSKAARTSRQ